MLQDVIERSSSPHSDAHSLPGLKWAIVVPTFRERENVAPLYRALQAAMPAEGWEVVFVDDASDDGTADVIMALARSNPNVRLVQRFGRRGLASAAIEGMMATIAPVVAVIDGDMQHDETILPNMFRAVDAGADLAIGSRYAGAGSTGDWSKNRVLISRFATKLSGGFGHNNVSDPMSGFIAIRRDLIVQIMPCLSIIGFKLLLDILLSSPMKLKIEEFHYTFKSRVAGESKLDAAVSSEFLFLLLEKKLGKWFPARFVMFIIVGGVGLCLNLILLRTFLHLDLPFTFSQTAAVCITIATNFYLNNLLTYRDRRLRGWRALRGMLSFYAVCGAGALANVGVAVAVYERHEQWWVAGVAGAAIGAVWNYAASSFLTWHKR